MIVFKNGILLCRKAMIMARLETDTTVVTVFSKIKDGYPSEFYWFLSGTFVRYDPDLPKMPKICEIP